MVEELKSMQETAQAVMEHLEWARDRMNRFKGERILRGKASFIEGVSSLRSSPRKERSSAGSAPTNSLRVRPKPQSRPAKA